MTTPVTMPQTTADVQAMTVAEVEAARAVILGQVATSIQAAIDTINGATAGLLWWDGKTPLLQQLSVTLPQTVQKLGGVPAAAPASS